MNAVEKRAYQLWKKAGKPGNQHESFWKEAAAHLILADEELDRAVADLEVWIANMEEKLKCL